MSSSVARVRGQVGNIVFEADDGVEDPEVRRVIEPFLAEVAAIEGVQSLESPYAPGNERQVSSEGDEAGRIAYAEFEAPSDASFEETVAIGDEIRAAMPSAEGCGSSSVGRRSPSSRCRRRKRSASGSRSSS